MIMHPHSLLLTLIAALVSFEAAVVLSAPATGNTETDGKNATCRASQYGKVFMISGGESRPWTHAVTYNHEEFARKNGHSYRFHLGNAAGPRKPYWSKVRLLIEELRKPTEEASAWVLWFDDDIVITDLTSDMLSRWQKEMLLEDKHVSVSEDPGGFTVLNTGMILIRRTDRALRLLLDLWKFGDGFLSRCTQERCLHEQQALQNLYSFGVNSDPDRYKRVLLVVPQRRKTDGFNINTFHRVSHFDPCRQSYQDYQSDSISSRWAPGDFVCHVSGMNLYLRSKLITQCLEHAHGIGEFPPMSIEADNTCVTS